MNENIIILGVDDKVENHLALEAVLADLDVTYISAYSGEEALECLLQYEIALILMDVMMPGLDGYQTAELIRGSRRTRDIPIIFISAIYTDQEHIFRGYKTGAVDYLTKPIIPEILRSKVTIFIEVFKQQRVLNEKACQLEQANFHISKQEKALRDSEVRFRTAFEQSFQFMAILDPQGKVLELNRLAKRLCGEHRGTLIAQYLWNICWVGQDEENLKLKEVIYRAAEGESINDEAKFTDVDGKVRYLYRSVSPVKDNNNNVVYITFQGHDITHHVQIESEKRNLELLLRQTQKMEALGVLAGGIAHDFNNVLSVIIGNAELAKRSGQNLSLDRQYLTRILSAATKAKDLVNQILSFSRYDEIKKVVLQPADIAMESIKLLRSSIPATIEIKHEIDLSCGSIFADPTQYHQVIMNLCTNAFHAMEESGGVLTIRLKQEKLESTDAFRQFNVKPGDYAHLIVEDNGRGVNKEYLDRIFDPYFTTKEKGKGTGMGLSIVYGIVKGYGGAICVDTKGAKGAAFHIYLPLTNGRRRSDINTIEELSYGNERILLVDDEELLLEMMKDMLELIGYQVTTTNSSTDALTQFCENPYDFDLIITDQTMPDMVGADLARKMLRLRPEIPIILCTGYSPNISRELVTSIGIKELAFKPFALDELSRMVRHTLDQVN